MKVHLKVGNFYKTRSGYEAYITRSEGMNRNFEMFSGSIYELPDHKFTWFSTGQLFSVSSPEYHPNPSSFGLKSVVHTSKDTQAPGLVERLLGQVHADLACPVVDLIEQQAERIEQLEGIIRAKDYDYNRAIDERDAALARAGVEVLTNKER